MIGRKGKRLRLTGGDDGLDVAALVSEICEAVLAGNPVAASRLGAGDGDGTLPDMSEEARRAGLAADRRWAGLLEAAASEGLGRAERLDRDVALAGLRGRICLREWGIEQRSAELYTWPVLTGVQALFQHRLRPDAELAGCAAARLRGARELLEAGRRALDPELACARLLRRAARQARSGAAFCRDAPALAGPGDDHGQAELREAGEVAARAYEDFAVFLSELAGRAHGHPGLGGARYNTLLAAREGCTLDIGGVHRLGTERLRDLRADLAQLYRDHPGLRDQARAAGHPASTAELLARYRSEVGRARRFCIEQDVLTLPGGEDCEVAAAPAFQLALLPVASYSPPPLLAPAASLRGRFLVPAPPAGVPAGQAARSLAAQRYAGFPNTVIHETYPGHHAHYAIMNAAVARHPVRALFPSAFFAEGWGVYAEQLARQRGYFTSPEMLQAHLASGAVRAARAAADAALHAGEMTPDQAEAYLSEQVRLPPAMAEAEVDRYLAYPAQAASYLVGATEITRIVAGNPSRQIHDRLTSAGSLPLSLAARNARES